MVIHRLRRNLNQRTPGSVTAAEPGDQQAVSSSSPAAAAGLLRPTAGHVSSRESPTRDVSQSLHDRQQTQSSVAPARQGRSSKWTKAETDQLSLLVGAYNTGGRINWVALHKEWQSRGLSNRTKAALTAKWRAIDTAPQASGATPITSATGASPTTSAYGATPTTSARALSTVLVGCDGQSAAPNGNTVEVARVSCPINGDLQEIGAGERGLDHSAIEAEFYKNLSKALKAKTRLGILPKRVDSQRAHSAISSVEQCVERELGATTLTWERLTAIVLAGAVTVSYSVRRGDQSRAQKARCWFAETKKKMNSLPTLIGKCTSEVARRKSGLKPTSQQVRNLRLLKREHKSETLDEITSLIEQLKVRLQLYKSRFESRSKEEDQRKLRSTFTVRGLPRLVGSKTPPVTPPNLTEVRGFWRKIVGLNKPFNPNDEDLLDWAESLGIGVETEHQPPVVDWESFEAILKKAKSWKAPGPDGIHVFWWKVFKQAGRQLYKLALSNISEGLELPQWLTCGRVVLIHKSGPPEDPANYRPIACLNTSYKLVTAMLAFHLCKHADRLNVLPVEQMAIRKGTWGCTHATILDQAVVADATNQKQKPLHVAWIDYAKAFDSVPHAYLRWLLKSMGVATNVQQFISCLLDKWSVHYEARGPNGRVAKSAKLQIRSGVLQGDSFSPFLFCLAMAPLSHAISKMELGYASSAGGRTADAKFHLSHLFYMDDLKIYSTSARSLEEVLCKVARVSGAISMLVNPAKCARASHEPSRLGPEEECEGYNGDVPDIRSLSIGDSYKYLGIEQRLGIKPSQAWGRAKARFLEVLEGIWSLDLTFRQKVNSTNAVIPILTYVVRNSFKGGGTYRSTLKRGDELDVQVRKLLVRQSARYKANAVERLYLPCDLGGCGLLSVRDSLIEATIYAWAYVSTRPDLVKQLALFQSLANRGKRCVLSDASTALEETGCIATTSSRRSVVLFDNTEYESPRDLARAITSAMRNNRNTRRLGAWKSLTSAGKVLHSECDLETSFLWLRSGKMAAVVVRNALAAQEGCLLVRASPSSRLPDKTCRKCGGSWETAEHVLTHCPAWLPNLYIYRHDLVAQRMHYRLCRKAGLKAPHYAQSVPGLLSNERYKLHWGQPVQCNAIIRHNKPDIVLYDEVEKSAVIVEVAVSWHTRMEQQKALKLNRYTVNGNEEGLSLPYPKGESLLTELVARGWKVRFIPVVIGACGEVSKGLLEELEGLGLGGAEALDCIEHMSRSSVLGSNRIIKQHLVQR